MPAVIPCWSYLSAVTLSPQSVLPLLLSPGIADVTPTLWKRFTSPQAYRALPHPLCARASGTSKALLMAAVIRDVSQTVSGLESIVEM